MPASPDAVMGVGTSGVSAAPPMRAFGDAAATRRAIYDDALAAANSVAPVEDDNYSLRLTGVDWMDPERFTRKRRKEAVLTGETLARRMRGTWELYDKKTGGLVGSRRQVVAAVPYLSSMGTFVHRGNEYTVNHQQRLKPGVFARVKDNGELESHFNILPGEGVSHRYFMDPETGVFKVKFGQAEMPIMPLLRAMGATDAELREAWGDKVTAANAAKNDDAVLKKLAQRLLRRREWEGLDAGSATKNLVARFNAMRLDPDVTRHTLGRPFASVSKAAILAATAKLRDINEKRAEPDDRDHLAYQTFFGPEDLFAERIRRDHGGVRRGVFKKIAAAGGDLSKMPSGALTPQVEQVLVGSGLAQALEEINPAEVFDKQTRITRLGEGGIPSVDSIPDEARSVQPSHMGFVDPIRTPESLRAGVDLHMARASRKGRDGKIYTGVRDRDGNLVWKTPQDLADSAVATPDVLRDKRWAGFKRVPVMVAGKLDYVTRDKIDYTLPDFSSAFSPLANLIPLMAQTKPGRVAMGSRYMTQALPLVNAEAPMVRGGVPGDPAGRSYEEEYGAHMGAVRAEKGGRVADVRDGVVHVKYDDGSKAEIELYQNHPFNRKTMVHQTPVVRPGDAFRPGDLLVRSNYTDDKGATALGLNMRVAYFPYKGLNFEDAIVVSEAAAKRLSSEHMYQHDLAVSDKHKVGKAAYVSLFPARYDKKTLARLDDRGIIRVGETVEYGDPLILAAKERDRAQNKIHKKRQPGYADDAVTWKHHDPGVVTDVVWGKDGPVVLVKSVSQMQVGDKMSGRYGDKGVVSAIVPDDQMPHDKDGKPFEVLLSPDGVITRCYDELTEFWTDSGWKFGRDVLPTDLLATYNPRTGQIVVDSQVQPMHVADYVGPMLAFENKVLDFCVTPNHKMWASPEAGFGWRETRADRISTGRWRLPVAGTPAPGRATPFRLPVIPRSSIKDTAWSDNEVLFDPADWAEFLGWYAAEGSCTFDPATPEYKVHIAQDAGVHPENCEAIGRLLDRLGVAWHYGKTNHQFHVGGKRLAAYMKRLGGSHERYVPAWVYSQPYQVRSRFLAAYWAGDGSPRKTKAGSVVNQAGSTSRRLADDLQRLLVLQGVSSAVYPKSERDGCREAWTVGVHLQTERLTGRDGWAVVSYSGKIYCPTVPSGYVVTRRNGKLLVAGNTNPSQEIEAALGKVAAKTGRPVVVPDFDDVDDLQAWAERQLKLHGLSGTEDVYWPEKGTRVTGVGTGYRFMMKLHHTAESKQQGRDSGAYSSDETPAKGGETGCFTGDTLLTVLGPRGRGTLDIAAVAENRLDVEVASCLLPHTHRKQASYGWERVTDWFAYEVPAEDLVTVTLANGKTVDCTRNHVFFLADGTKKAAGDLAPGDDLLEAV